MQAETMSDILPCNKKRIALVGVGNILMGDDGIGVALVEELKKVISSNRIELIDAGTAFFSIAPELMDYGTLIILDAVSGGGEPGTMYRFELEALSAFPRVGGSSISLHEFGVAESLALERLRGKLPEKVVIFGVEPSNVRLDAPLSTALEEKMGYYIEKIMKEICTYNVQVLS